MRFASAHAAIALAALALTACSTQPADPATHPSSEGVVAPAEKREPLLLFTSLPIYWSEGGVGDLLSSTAPVHWARTALETRYDLTPLDTLTALPENGVLLMAQPRALSGDENVALDDFVRRGGRVVMIVDPMLDVHSAYGFGDRRRPEAISMLSPILGRWGLRLVHDDREAHEASWNGVTIPVEEGGLFELTDTGHDSRCHLSSGGLVARCNVGAGKVMLLADATFLADGDHAGQAADTVLFDLIDAASTPPSAP
ncbi:Gldg family protein [Croceicoccus sediminis]|uniref:Gldg family protein n=1 Tax=Croceicoccus sediminis TaxID=2571150 RepID=UPI001183C82B|nr:ABC transporter [Croceicoccus sediminis]